MRRSLAASRHVPLVAVLGIIVVVHVAAEVGRAMEPVTRTDEDTAVKPFRPVVTIGHAVVGGVVVIAVRAAWLSAEGHRNLGVRRSCGDQQENSRSGCGNETVLDAVHERVPLAVRR